MRPARRGQIGGRLGALRGTRPVRGTGGVAAAYIDLDQIGFISPVPGRGLSWPQPGDPLIGQPEAHLRRVAAEAEAAAEAAALERSGLGDLRIDTDGRTVAEVADLVARRWS